MSMVLYFWFRDLIHLSSQAMTIM